MPLFYPYLVVLIFARAASALGNWHQFPENQSAISLEIFVSAAILSLLRC